jgi:RHS repeat-associated protein
MTHANASLAQHDYDAAGRLTALRNLKSDLSVISIFTYSYDPLGNRTSVAEANGDRVTWSYDGIYQLTREQRSGANAYDATYTYDGLGNRLTKVEGGTTTTYSYDAANELTVEQAGASYTTYSYDANGNTSVENAAGSRTTYSWDTENHLTRVELPTGTVNTITLDGDGKRFSIEDSDGFRYIGWDEENIIGELNNLGVTIVRYTLAPEGGVHPERSEWGNLVSQRRSGATSFHHFDAPASLGHEASYAGRSGLGSTDRLTDSSQATLIAYLYRAFGLQTILSGSHANRMSWNGRWGYYRQTDAEDYWVRARIMKPKPGRWLSRDAVLAKPKRPYEGAYLYAENDPCLGVDPSGRQVTFHCYSYIGCWPWRWIACWFFCGSCRRNDCPLWCGKHYDPEGPKYEACETACETGRATNPVNKGLIVCGPCRITGRICYWDCTNMPPVDW